MLKLTEEKLRRSIRRIPTRMITQIQALSALTKGYENMSKTVTKPSKLGARTWFNLCLFGFVGQVAWNLENMYFNTFLYNTVYEGGTVTQGLSSMQAIKLMVAFSAITAVVTTFIMGNLSDRVHKRKIFISMGYIIWGITVVAFGFITKENISRIFGIDAVNIGAAVTATSVTVIVMDCVMTFIGSTGNDSAFNAYVTDVGSGDNRATVESVLAILPMAAMIIVIVFGGFIESIGYKMFFLIIGGLVVLSGVTGLFTLTDTMDGKKQVNGSYWSDLFYGFRPAVIKENSKLYLALTASCIYCIAVQIFFPYLLIYLEHSLGFKIENLMAYVFDESGAFILPIPVLIGIPVALVVAVAAIIGIGKLIDRIGKDILVFVAVALFVIGLGAAYFAHTIGTFAISAIPFLIGFAFVGIMLNAAVRDYTPEDKVGLFQGIRMIFGVLIPMVVGPFIGDLVCRLSASGQYIDEVGNTSYEPCSAMFLAASIVSAMCIIPLIILKKKGFSEKKAS